MLRLVLALIPLSLLLSLVLAAALVRVSTALGAFDGAGVAGQVKAPRRRVPNTGGVAIFWAVVLPIAACVVHLWPLAREDKEWQEGPALVPVDLWPHIDGLVERAPLAAWLFGAAAVLHVLGLVDDRRPLGPWLKLGIMTACAAAVVLMTETRIGTMLDPLVGGPWASVLVSVGWFVVVTNAMNFMDNMDGLAGGVAAVVATSLLAAALLAGQWFVGAVLALLLGALLGFLCFNRPPARIFMGDGGSLVVGFLLAFLSVRLTYFDPAAGWSERAVDWGRAGAWHAVLTPLVVLAVPLYDLVAVIAVRLSQRRSPLVGDLQHLSHRLVRRGLSRPQAVGVIVGLSGVTGVSGVLLGAVPAWGAVLIGVQVLLTLLVLAAYERASSPAHRDTSEPGAAS